jgi:hypothetical protein
VSAIVLRVLIYVIIAGAIFFAVRKIWRDWKGAFKVEDAAKRARDLRERQRPDVITLKRDKDGTFRPPDEER